MVDAQLVLKVLAQLLLVLHQGDSGETAMRETARETAIREMESGHRVHGKREG